jgi:thioredoxin-related protein
LIRLWEERFMMGRRVRWLSPLILTIGLFVVVLSPAKAAELLMFESPICEWCEAWNEEIGPIYPKTQEGKRAPLRRVNLYDERPADLRHIEGIRFTPTFVLIDDSGAEVGRINGYPGEDFFWGLLSELMAKLPNEVDDQLKNI